MELKINKAEQLKPKPDENALGFGTLFTDHMFNMDYHPDKGWHNPRIEPYADIAMDPATMDLFIIIDNIGLFLAGLKHTIQLVAISLAVGLIVAIPLSIWISSKTLLIRMPIRAYVYFFRGTPLLVQMYIIYYGLGQFNTVQTSFVWPLFKEAYFCALLAFTLNTCAYTTEILRGAITATPPGEIEAAKAAGMSRMVMLRHIILPSAFRRALPSYGNEMIFMLHGTSLASVITIVDITGAARIINSRYYCPYEAFITAAAFYLFLTLVMVWMLKKLERRWSAHLRPLPAAVRH